MKTNASDSGGFCHGALTQHVPTWRRLRGFIDVTAKLSEDGSICRRHNTTQEQAGVWEGRGLFLRLVNVNEPLSPRVGTPFHRVCFETGTGETWRWRLAKQQKKHL